MKLRNTTIQNCCIILWYEERKQVDKMKSKMKSTVAMHTLKQQLYVMQNQLDRKHKVIV